MREMADMIGHVRGRFASERGSSSELVVISMLAIFGCVVAICICSGFLMTQLLWSSRTARESMERQADDIAEIQTRAAAGTMSEDDVSALSSYGDVTAPWCVTDGDEVLTWRFDGFSETSEASGCYRMATWTCVDGSGAVRHVERMPCKVVPTAYAGIVPIDGRGQFSDSVGSESGDGGALAASMAAICAGNAMVSAR